MSPNATPDSKVIVSAKPRTTGSIEISDNLGRFAGPIATSVRRPA